MLSMHSIKIRDFVCASYVKTSAGLANCVYTDKAVSFDLDYIRPLNDFRVRSRQKKSHGGDSL